MQYLTTWYHGIRAKRRVVSLCALTAHPFTRRFILLQHCGVPSRILLRGFSLEFAFVRCHLIMQELVLAWEEVHCKGTSFKPLQRLYYLCALQICFLRFAWECGNLLCSSPFRFEYLNQTLICVRA